MNFIRKFIGGASKTDEVASIHSGKLFLTRSPQSPKGEFECLYNDAFASIQQTTTPYFYQLCITRASKEGELDYSRGSDGFPEDSDEDEEFADDSDHNKKALGAEASKDEWNYPITPDLKIQYYEKANGNRAIVWLDLNGDEGDKFEFIIDEDVPHVDIDAFVLSLFKTLYESRYHKSSSNIRSLKQLQEFVDPAENDYLNLAQLQSYSTQ